MFYDTPNYAIIRAMERNLYNLSKTELIFKNAFQNMPERELK